MSKIMRWMRKLSHAGNDAVPSPPSTTIPFQSSPRAIYQSEMSQDMVSKLRRAEPQSLLIIVLNAEGATDGFGLCRVCIVESALDAGQLSSADAPWIRYWTRRCDGTTQSWKTISHSFATATPMKFVSNRLNSWWLTRPCETFTPELCTM
jgi:hypothetical protein